MSSKSIEQFEVLSNALRILPERVFQISYYVNEVNDPEEGIANIESAYRNVLNQIYGMMCALKDDGYISSIYEDTAITTILCLRHAMQHLSGKIRNCLRDLILESKPIMPIEIVYSASNEDIGRCPFFISATWVESGIKSSNYANKWPKIADYWQLEKLQKEVASNDKDWDSVYFDGTSLVMEAMSHLVKKYGKYFSPSGFDSNVYYEHFNKVSSLDREDCAIVA